MWMLIRLRTLFLAAVFLAATADPLLAHAATPNLVQIENSQPGTTAWMLGPNVADDVNNQIKGYASATSVNQNESRRASRPGPSPTGRSRLVYCAKASTPFE